ncbi:MAG: choice-of-anchor P family protein, partial [Nocardioides sp.]|nr:choice-of-anchor P family protein [Nocardioides sp.]
MTASALVLAGATAPAQAHHLGKKVTTDFSFQSSNWATRVIANDVELRSARTAYAYIACTRVANRHTRTLGQTAKVNANEMIQVSGLESQVQTYFKRKKGETGVRGTNVIASVELGSNDGPKLTIEGLRTVARAFHVRGKGFRTAKRINWASIGLDMAGQGSGTGTPLDDLIKAINTQVVGEVFGVLAENGPIAIPGLGEIALGRSFQRRKRGSIERSQYAIVVKLENGSKVQIGRAWAKISTDVPSGVFHGAGYGTNITALESGETGPIVRVGRTAAKPLPCNGTDGKIQSRSLAGLNFLAQNAIEIDAIKSSVLGEFGKGKRARGWTQNEIAKVNLGDGALVLSAIKGRANVRRGAKGKVFANSRGTNGAISITAGGEEYTAAELLAALENEEIVIPGLLAIRFNVKKKLRRGIKVVAVRITIAEETTTG